MPKPIITRHHHPSRHHRLAPFMQQLAAQDRIFVILSEKYLKSANCMYELFEIWRNVLLPDPDFLTPKARAKIATYWKTQFAELDAEVKQHGADILGAEDFKNYTRTALSLLLFFMRKDT